MKEKKNSIFDFVTRLIRLIDSRVRYSTIIDGIIIGVDETKYTATVKCQDTEFHEVPLKVLMSEVAGFIEIPKINTACTLSFRDNNMGRPQLISVHQVDKVLIKCDNVIFNDGELGAMVTKDIVSKLNNIENDINNLKTLFTSWIVVAMDGGSALKTITATWASSPIQLTQLNQVTTEKIKQ